ncbi:DNA gyrase inhibitor YacG [Pseudooceanicola sp. C21-150M6]|uniref:DNA gyrase inhibitor YacG n=1 Tax=Pseudooceanicola sp. C21-150M6 TaxID=3434355 RepID=UPI003D7FBEAC
MSCPICNKPTQQDYRPFCSKKCADIDLGRWMRGSYAIPSNDPQDIEEALDALERGAAAKPQDDEPTRH